MRVFVLEFIGVNIEGTAVVVARDRVSAIAMALEHEAIRAVSVWTAQNRPPRQLQAADFHVTEANAEEPNVVFVDNGTLPEPDPPDRD